jgi:two-component system response regulator PilR (NtrC family)
MQQSQLSLTPQALQALMDYPFPGNIRELENILERAVALCDSERIDTEHLHFDSHQSEDHSSQPSAKQTHNAAFPTPQQRVNDAGEAYLDLEEYLAEIEKKIISDTLEECRWNRTYAAKKLGLSFRSLRYRLAKLGIE